MKARISNLSKTEAEWSKITFKPLLGELVIYMPDSEVKHARLKVGDGIHYLHELPFAIEAVAKALLERYARSEDFDAGRITDYFE